ncbi:MAG: hypothetical protein IPK26_14950 [Planctomycetes bacterium]|nr:hypothetical protein [Planctomycetota bacterium]
MHSPPEQHEWQGADIDFAARLLALLGQRRQAERAVRLTRLLQSWLPLPGCRPDASGGSRPRGRWSSAIEILRARFERDLAHP